MDDVAVIPLTWQDQSVLDLEGASDPWNIQLEIGSAGRVDVERLTAALEAACRRHPMMRSRLVHGGGLAASSSWRHVDDAHLDVATARVESDTELDEARTEFHSRAFDLAHEPPLRVLVLERGVAAGGGDEGGPGDLVLFDAAHPVVDGIGLLRFLRSVTAHYRGLDDPDDPVTLAEARDLPTLLAPTSGQERVRRALEGGAKALGAARSPARVSRDSADPRRASGFTHREVDVEVVAGLNALRPPGATLNDLLLAGTMLAIQAWNDDHGSPADKVQLFVPVSMRPAAWSAEMVTNLFSYVSVDTVRSERADLVTTTRAVARRTHTDVRTGRSRGTQDLLRMVAPVPLTVKRLMPHLLTLTGNRFVDSAVVSNLGRPADVPSFDDGPPTEVHFTPPYWSAASVSVGAISSAGRLYVGLRHRLSDLDGPAGERFADLLVATLTDPLG